MSHRESDQTHRRLSNVGGLLPLAQGLTPMSEDGFTASRDRREIRATRPATTYRTVTGGGVTHLVTAGASGPPFLTLCGTSVAGLLQPENPHRIITPCPRCVRIRVEAQPWRR